jgi:hypothetical protein
MASECKFSAFEVGDLLRMTNLSVTCLTCHEVFNLGTRDLRYCGHTVVAGRLVDTFELAGEKAYCPECNALLMTAEMGCDDAFARFALVELEVAA